MLVQFQAQHKRAVLYSLRATFEIMPTEVDLVPLILIFVEVDFVFLHHPTRRLRCNTVRCDHITGNGHWIEHIWVLCAHYEPVTSVLCINTAHINWWTWGTWWIDMTWVECVPYGHYRCFIIGLPPSNVRFWVCPAGTYSMPLEIFRQSTRKTVFFVFLTDND